MSRTGSSVAPTIASRITTNMKINDYSQAINDILAEQDRRFANSQDDSIKKKTVVHFGDSKITLPELYGLVLKNRTMLKLFLPMIDSIIKKLIDCIKEETNPL